MSKVLVDRELLERTATHLEWDGSEPMTTIQFAQKCDGLADELRRAIAQPAEVQGAELVPFWVLFDATTPEPLIKKHMPEGVLAFFDNEEDARRAKALHPGTDYKRAPYVRAAALSAVTAERDAALASLERAYANYNQVSYASTERGKQIDQLRAEVEALRALLGKSLPVVEAHAGASHMLEGFRPTRNKWDELVDGIRAAIEAAGVTVRG